MHGNWTQQQSFAGVPPDNNRPKTHESRQRSEFVSGDDAKTFDRHDAFAQPVGRQREPAGAEGGIEQSFAFPEIVGYFVVEPKHVL